VLAEKLRACIDKAIQDVVAENHSSEPKKSTTEVELYSLSQVDEIQCN